MICSRRRPLPVVSIKNCVAWIFASTAFQNRNLWISMNECPPVSFGPMQSIFCTIVCGNPAIDWKTYHFSITQNVLWLVVGGNEVITIRNIRKHVKCILWSNKFRSSAPWVFISILLKFAIQTETVASVRTRCLMVPFDISRNSFMFLVNRYIRPEQDTVNYSCW